MTQNDKVIDAACWTSSKPTESEKKEQEELFELDGWNSPDINSCILSDNIEKEQSITRKGLTDTNSKEDWNEFIKKEEELAPPEVQEVQEPEAINESPSSIIQDPTNETALVSIPQPEAIKIPEKTITAPAIVEVDEPVIPTKTEPKSTSKSKKTSSKSYKNGNLSNSIKISEILPKS